MVHQPYRRTLFIHTSLSDIPTLTPARPPKIESDSKDDGGKFSSASTLHGLFIVQLLTARMNCGNPPLKPTTQPPHFTRGLNLKDIAGFLPLTARGVTAGRDPDQANLSRLNPRWHTKTPIFLDCTGIHTTNFLCGSNA